ncbi:MAG: putative peptidoglycan binding domain-containing protein, partial [Deinococcales bacterium]
LGRLLAVLERAGRHRADAGWSPEALRALQELAGVENLEERLTHADRIDRLALEHLERRYPG